MDWRIPLSDLDYGQEEEAAVHKVLRSGWLTMGEVTQAFEHEFAQYLGAKHAIAVSNGTAALHLACLSLGLGKGDEVILPALTFVATANAILYTGATPVFADIESEEDLTISPDSIEARINDKTRAIMVMHYAGYACDMPRIRELAEKNNLVIIEDAAHAIGAEMDNNKLGLWGDVACFSFFSNKNLITGEGGMVVTDNDEIAEKIRILRSHGMTTVTWDRHKGHAWSYDVVELGYNYRLDEIRSALGRVQLGKLEENNARRRSLTTHYRELFQELVPLVTVPFENHPGISSHHIMPILLPRGSDRNAMMESMKSEGIQTSIHYPPINSFLRYNSYNNSVDLPKTEDIAGREVTLPLFPTLDDSEVEIVVQAVWKSLQSV
ncbi:MAG: DegT/DnrJ/EryC1/StrS family aminotransferase [Chloroflexi bacterium]|nr:DegT/DnrJ/EryC1/StrS family aminotransferase [Chloroflexota bacterium]